MPSPQFFISISPQIEDMLNQSLWLNGNVWYINTCSLRRETNDIKFNLLGETCGLMPKKTGGKFHTNLRHRGSTAPINYDNDFH